MSKCKDFVERQFSNGSALMRWSEFGGLIVYYHVHNQYFSPLGAFFGSGRGSSAHLFLGRSCRQTILGTLWLLNFDWRLMG